MNGNSRTAKSIKNSSVALIIYFINLVLQFFSRKIFLDHLGAEVLGLNTTATNLLQFLNLAELGIGTAVGFSLYKPFYDGDEQTINEIVSLQGKLYRRIACVVIAAAAVLMCFFPLIFAKMELPLWYAYASFGVLLFSALLSYFVNYRQVLLAADQQEYKIQYSYKASILIKVVTQIIAVKFLPHGYIWWLILEVVFAIIASYALHRTIVRTYKFIKTSPLSFKELNAKYPTIKVKIGQVFIHKATQFALPQISSLIIYAYTSLTVVALYGNYNLIVLGFISMMASLLNGLSASVGNLAAEGSVDRVLAVFEELFSVRFLLSAVMCFGLYALGQPFITLWIGEEYVLPDSTLLLICINMFIQISRATLSPYVDAYGYYSDIWAPAAEAVLNISFSVLLGYYFGLNGVLTGYMISLVVLGLCWRPIFLFGIKLKRGLATYAWIFVKHLFCGLAVAFAVYKILELAPLQIPRDLWSFVQYGAVYLSLFSVLLFLLLCIVSRGMRSFISRTGRLMKRA